MCTLGVGPGKMSIYRGLPMDSWKGEGLQPRVLAVHWASTRPDGRCGDGQAGDRTLSARSRGVYGALAREAQQVLAAAMIRGILAIGTRQPRVKGQGTAPWSRCWSGQADVAVCRGDPDA